MGPGLRTVLRVTVALAVLAFLLYGLQQSHYFTKFNVLIIGGTLVAGGVLSFFYAAKFDREMPDLRERLTPVWGYALPKRGQLAVRYLIIASGLGLIAWSLFD